MPTLVIHSLAELGRLNDATRTLRALPHHVVLRLDSVDPVRLASAERDVNRLLGSCGCFESAAAALSAGGCMLAYAWPTASWTLGEGVRVASLTVVSLLGAAAVTKLLFLVIMRWRVRRDTTRLIEVHDHGLKNPRTVDSRRQP